MRCGGMCVGPVSFCGAHRGPNVVPVSGAAAGGVGAVFCAADSAAGQSVSNTFV